MSTANEKMDDAAIKKEPVESNCSTTGAPDPAGLEEGDLDAFTVAEERAVRLKFDLTIVPIVTILYMCCAIDRASIGNGSRLAASRRLTEATLLNQCFRKN